MIAAIIVAAGLSVFIVRAGFETHTGELLVKDDEVEALEHEGQEKIARRVQPPAPKAVS